MTYEEPSDARGTAPIVAERSAAVRNEGGTAADPWPSWAQEQLARAVALHATIPASVSAASVLYREWFNPLVEPAPFTPGRPLAGLYRSAHAASERTRDVGGMLVLGRNDVVGADGWWRTWGAHWTPPRTRPGSVRLFLSPRREHLADVVGTVTELLADVETSWTLGCATDPRRVRRCAAATLDVAELAALPRELFARLEPLLHPVVPPLALPVTDHVALASYPANGMSFGEHRCHLVSLGLRHPSGARDPLRAIAAVFAAQGVDPAQPYS